MKSAYERDIRERIKHMGKQYPDDYGVTVPVGVLRGVMADLDMWREIVTHGGKIQAMIEWKVHPDQRRGNDWVGWIAGRPLYYIRSTDTGLTLLDAVSHEEIACASGGDALAEAQKRAEQHRAELTGGLHP